MNTIVPVKRLRELVAAKIERLDLSYQKASEQIGLPDKGVVYGLVMRSRRPDVDAHVKLQRWVGIGLDSQAQESYMSSMEAVVYFTERDPRLTPENAKLLQGLMRAAYDNVTK